MIVQATTIASTNADDMAGSCRLRCEKLKVTAVLDTRPPRIPVSDEPVLVPKHFDQHIAEEIQPRDQDDHQPDLVRIDDIERRRAKHLIGQERQNDHADHGELQGRLHVRELDASRQAMQVVLQGQQQKADHVATLATPTLSQPHKAPTMNASSAVISVVIPSSPRAAVS